MDSNETTSLHVPQIFEQRTTAWRSHNRSAELRTSASSVEPSKPRAKKYNHQKTRIDTSKCSDSRPLVSISGSFFVPLVVATPRCVHLRLQGILAGLLSTPTRRFDRFFTEPPVVYTRKPNLSGQSRLPAAESSYHSRLGHRRSRDRSHCSGWRYARESGTSSGKIGRAHV